MIAYFPDTPAIVSSNRILYTASPFARSSLFHLQEAGELQALQAHTSRRENLASYLFFTVQSGSGRLEYQGKQYKLTAGDNIFINCQLPYSHTTDTDLWNIQWIHFNGPTLDSIYSKYCDRGGQPVFRPKEQPAQDKINKIWTEIMNTAGSADYMKDMKINALLSEMLVFIMAESWHPEKKKSTSKRASMLAIKEYIDQNYKRSIKLNELAEKFYIDKYYLSKTYKKQFGQNISSYLQMVRITKAKQLLRFTDQTLEEIAEAVGITPARYFSEVFRSVEGISPSTYRKQW